MNNSSTFTDLRELFIESEEGNDTSNDLEEEDLRRKKEQVETALLERISYISGATVAGWVEVQPFSLLERIAELQRENEHLQQQMAELKNRVDQLVENLPMQKTVILREISEKEAKQKIKELFDSTSEPLYYSDIAEKLQLDLEMVVRICQELIEEGEIEIDTDVL